jgi:hypothetical protein
MSKNKFLVVCEDNSGMAYATNVAVIFANTIEEAEKEARKNPDGYASVNVYPLTDITNDWWFYT